MSDNKVRSPDIVNIMDLKFEKFIDQKDIDERVKALGEILSDDYRGTVPVFMGVLNGAFVFLADLIRGMNIAVELVFVRAESYRGTESTGEVSLNMLERDYSSRDVLIVEDIVDKGHTIDRLIEYLGSKNPNSVKIASFLKKPNAYQYEHRIDYCCYEIPNDFVVGYGLDYNQMGRELPSLYKLKS